MRIKKFIAIISIMAMALIAVGCGNSVSGHSAGEDFEFADNTYSLEKWVRIADEDSDSLECYGVCLLLEGNSAPIIMSISNGQPQSAVNMELIKEDGDTIGAIGTNFEGIDDQGKYGVRMTFKFKIPKGEELPPQGKLINNSDKGQTAELNLTSISLEE